MKRYKLGELIDVTRGATLPGENYSKDGKLIRITLGNFDYVNNGFKENTSKDNIFYKGSVPSEFILNKGDIITPLTEQAIGLLGSTTKIPISGKYIQSQDVALVSVKSDNLLKEYVYFLLPTPGVKKQLSAGAQQTSIRHTSPDKIKDCTVFIPEKKEQKSIALFLESIEERISLLKEENLKLDELATTIYDYWFLQFDFPDHSGRAYRTSGGKMIYNDLFCRDIPERWDVKALGDFTRDEMPSVNPSDTPDAFFRHFSIPEYDNSEYYALEMGREIKSNKYCVSEKDVLVSKLNPWTSRVLWGVSLDNLICSSEFVSLAPLNTKIKGFVYYLAKSQPFISYCTQGSTGTSHSHRRINPDIMKMFKVPYNEDVMIAFSELVEPYVERIMSNRAEIFELFSLRNFVMPLLMNGQATITE